jgi:hypothetical protein
LRDARQQLLCRAVDATLQMNFVVITGAVLIVFVVIVIDPTVEVGVGVGVAGGSAWW